MAKRLIFKDFLNIEVRDGVQILVSILGEAESEKMNPDAALLSLFP